MPTIQEMRELAKLLHYRTENFASPVAQKFLVENPYEKAYGILVKLRYAEDATPASRASGAIASCEHALVKQLMYHRLRNQGRRSLAYKRTHDLGSRSGPHALEREATDAETICKMQRQSKHALGDVELLPDRAAERFQPVWFESAVEENGAIECVESIVINVIARTDLPSAVAVNGHDHSLQRSRNQRTNRIASVVKEVPKDLMASRKPRRRSDVPRPSNPKRLSSWRTELDINHSFYMHPAAEHPQNRIRGKERRIVQRDVTPGRVARY